MSKKGSESSKNSKETKKVDLNRTTLIAICGVALVILVITAVWWFSRNNETTTEENGLSQEEAEFQALVDESAKALPAEEVEQQIDAKTEEITEIESEEARASAYYDLAYLHYLKGNFEEVFSTLDEAEGLVSADDEVLQNKIKELRSIAESEYEYLKYYL